MAVITLCRALLLLFLQNMKKYFSFEVQVLDDKNVRRRFRASNYQVQLQGREHLEQYQHACWAVHVLVCLQVPHRSTVHHADSALVLQQANTLVHHALGMLPSTRLCCAVPCACLHHYAEHYTREALHMHHAHAPR